MRFSGFLIPALTFATLSACSSSNVLTEAVESRLIDGSFVGGEASSKAGAVARFAGRIEERDGQVFACAAISHNEAPAAKIAAAELRVALRFHVDEEKLNVGLRFAPVYADSLRLVGRQANCASLGIPWEARFATGDVRLKFRRLRF